MTLDLSSASHDRLKTFESDLASQYAGATFPYGRDPNDANIRIAPSVPTVEEVDAAMSVFTLCVTLASVRQALS